MMTTETKYPECEKLAGFSEESQKIGAFIEWLVNNKGIELDCTIETLLAEYFDVDLKKVEKERQQILDDIQAVNNPTPSNE